MRRAIYSLLILLIMNSIVSAQTINIGFRLESIGYSYESLLFKKTRIAGNPCPSSFYFKVAIVLPENYQLELKTGLQLERSVFGGPEYAALVKYEILRGLSPLMTYLLHYNSGDSRNAGGTYEHYMSFLGGGIEVKITKVFAMDLIYYKPLGERRLNFFSELYGQRRTVSEINSMLKLGLVFSFDMWEL